MDQDHWETSSKKMSQKYSREQIDALTFVSDKPNVGALVTAFNDTQANIGDYLDACRRAYEARHEVWDDKTEDLRKWGPDRVPWEGASDLETRLVQSKLETMSALLLDALHRSHIEAYPVEAGDAVRARLVSAFLKWMVTSWIKGFTRCSEQDADRFLEKAVMITYTGWEKRTISRPVNMSFEEIAGNSPEAAASIRSGDNDGEWIADLQERFGTTAKAAKKALKELRTKGETVLPGISEEESCPWVKSCAADYEVLFPFWCTDPSRAPYAFYRDFLTPQEIWGRVYSEGWSEKWAEYVIEHLAGQSTVMIDQEVAGDRKNDRSGRSRIESSELVEVVTVFQRLIDKETGAEGIHRTVINPSLTEANAEVDEPWALFELMEGERDFPLEVTELSHAEPELYEVTTLPEMIRSTQMIVKDERDGRRDRNSLATLSWITHKHGEPPEDIGPGRFIGVTSHDELQYGPTPALNPDAIALDEHLTREADELLGLNADDPNSSVKKTKVIRKYLDHYRRVLIRVYENYKAHGPAKLFFRVVGMPERMEMLKVEEEKMDININFDTLYSDPDSIEKAVQMLFQLVPMDKSGRINVDALLTYAAALISPSLANQILQPSETGTQDILKQFADDWSKLWSGIPTEPPPNGAPIILQAIEGLKQQPDVVRRMQEDEGLQDRVGEYLKKVQFQVEQGVNAERGRRGGDPAPMNSKPAPFPGNEVAAGV